MELWPKSSQWKARLLTLLRSRRLQPLWRQMHRLSLIGMNYWASEASFTGERAALAYVAARLSPVERPMIFDVGANVGDFALMCLAQFGRRCIVHAFEPSKRAADLLETRLGGKIEAVALHRMALSDHRGFGTLYSSEPGSTIASLENLERPVRAFDPCFSEEVVLSTIDDFCAEHSIEHVDLIKLDIEGHELSALRGAQRMLSENRIGFIQFEFGENNVSSRTFMLDFVKLFGGKFSMFRIVPGGLVQFEYENGLSEIFATMNYLCEFRNRN